MTRYQLHVQNWKDCHRCVLDEGRGRVVLARGSVPCDVLFVGEAPGESEDVIGRPFVGPAGRLLDQIIERALPAGTRFAMTNLVGCIPRDEDGGKVSEPDDDCVKACAPRLVDLVDMCKPRIVVRVGKVATYWLDPTLKNSVKLGREVQFVDIVHPAAILRANVAQQGLMVQRCVVTLQTAIEELS